MNTGTVVKWGSLAAMLLCAGCANVKPWEMATFSSHVMRDDRDPIGDGFAEHVHFTREASSGGQGVGGGGCGCN
jgi:hypothetical protein